jgi:hypothetical protein
MVVAMREQEALVVAVKKDFRRCRGNDLRD